MNRLQNRRGVIGSELCATNLTITNFPVALPPLRMVKQEALEDKCHNKRGKFFDLTTVRGRHRITIVNGKLIYKGFTLTTKESGRFKFIQDKNGDLFGVESSDNPDGLSIHQYWGRTGQYPQEQFAPQMVLYKCSLVHQVIFGQVLSI
ncbi:hypothetical protein ACLMPM_24290 [Yersinia enterocolitica]|uniref:hypothetical protein n=1 Tax=Yersinia enterocolitica TaxID=630 RepID=UPI00398D166D